MVSVTVAIALVLVAGYANATPRLSSPPLPYYDWGLCPFECCTYREWTANAPTRLLKERRRSAQLLFELKPGEKVLAVTGVVVTTRAGLAKVFKPITLGAFGIRVSPNDVVSILNYQGEGYWKFWWRGQVDREQIPDINDTAPDADLALRVITRPQTAWWVKIRNRRGQVGWTDETNHFDQMDACE